MIFKKENALDFNCESCGSCCKHFNVNITHLDIQRILENRKDLKVDDFVTTTFSEDKEDNESFIS
ncbi:MAG: YkgJ family cysteine cluster protein, partial [Candidatus Sericytochromatia bacterium]